MRKLILFLVSSVVTLGCSISVNEGDDDWDDDWESDGFRDERTVQERAADVCDPYCIELIDCGALSDGAFVSCRDLCMERFEEDEREVTEGCACVQAAQCQADAASACDGDPLPGVLDHAPESNRDENPEDAAGGSSSGGDYSTESCSTNHDCAPGEDCIDGSCLARCAASCQCDEGFSCEDGYCVEPLDPTENCETDCDCTSGMQCVSGNCE